ncbi:MAG TPA: hypothetical protein VM533_04460 [Fimbriiglobus sp.]|nr:hypothetical protein [Fimbriiglobus sp.]
MREQTVSTKAVVTVSEMARIVGLSRARFYELVEAGVFPTPVYDASARRPLYDEKLQEACLTVRRRNLGINGKPVLFYARGHRATTPTVRPSKQPVAKPKTTIAHADLLDGLGALGLVATPAQVAEAVAALYPAGVNGTDRGQVLRDVFLRLKASGHSG